MSIPLTINGAVFNYPVNFDNTGWGIDATGWAQAVTTGMLQKAGGSFPLTADVDFGGAFGLKSLYLISHTANPAQSGVVRLAKTDTMAWRNNANSADLPLGIDGSNNLTFNGSTLSFSGAVNPGTANQLAYYATTSNAVSGLTLISPNKALISNASGLPIASSVSDTTLAFLDATSSVQTQLNSISSVANAALPRTGGTMTGSIIMGANIAMGANKITNLAAATTSGDALSYGQVGALLAGLALGSSKLTGVANGTTASDGAAFGQLHILQPPVFGSETTGGTTTSTSFVAAGATLTITPTSSTSKIILFGIGCLSANTSTDGQSAILGLGRNGVQLFSAMTSPSRLITGGNSSTFASTLTTFFLDTSGTTSPITYTLMIAGSGNTVTLGAALGAGIATYILAVEIL